jgi:hypothetical protein
VLRALARLSGEGLLEDGALARSSAKSGTSGGFGRLLIAACCRRAAREMLRATLRAMPSSQGSSEPPSGLTVPRSRQASRNVSETTSSGRPVAGQPERVVVDGAGVLLEEHAELVMVPGAHPGALTQLHALFCPVLVIEFPAAWFPAWLGGRR